MSWIDAAIVIIFLFFIVTAFQAGFIRETIGMGSAIVGVVCGGLFYENIADSLLGSIDNETTKSVVAFLIIFGTITVVGQLIAMLVQPASGSCPRAMALTCTGKDSRIWISTLWTSAFVTGGVSGSGSGPSVGFVRLERADTQQLPTVSSGQITRHQLPLPLTPVTFAV